MRTASSQLTRAKNQIVDLCSEITNKITISGKRIPRALTYYSDLLQHGCNEKLNSLCFHVATPERNDIYILDPYCSVSFPYHCFTVNFNHFIILTNRNIYLPINTLWLCNVPTIVYTKSLKLLIIRYLIIRR